MEVVCILEGTKRQDFSKFFELGFSWSDSKTLSIFYIPDAITAASVFTLGIICRDLTDDSKNDKEVHFQTLLQNAKDYLEVCSPCKFKCDPKLAECNRFEQASPTYKKIDDAKVYSLESSDTLNRTITLRITKKPTKKTPFESTISQTIFENYSDRWFIQGKPPMLSTSSRAILNDTYKELSLGDATDSNLRNSYTKTSFVCANNETINTLLTLPVYINGKDCILGEMLTLAGDRIARINPITALNNGGLDTSKRPENAIFTNLYSALKLIDFPLFSESEKIVFVDPTESDPKISALLDYVDSNRDWLKIDDLKIQLVTKKLGIENNNFIALTET
jgi:hypothetical protein